MARFLRTASLTVALTACSSPQTLDPNEGSSTGPETLDEPEECPRSEPTPGFALDFRIAVCDDADCSTTSVGPIRASYDPEVPWEQSSLVLELECATEELRSSDLDAGFELVLACELDATLPGDERLLVTGFGRPVGASGSTLDVSLGDALTVRIESYYDGWNLEPTRTAITRTNDGALVVMYNLVSEPLPIEVRSRTVCEEEGACGGIEWRAELGFGPEGAETWLDERQAADIGGGLRAWVEESNGFDDAACGVYSQNSYVVLLVARVR